MENNTEKNPGKTLEKAMEKDLGKAFSLMKILLVKNILRLDIFDIEMNLLKKNNNLLNILLSGQARPAGIPYMRLHS